jgi:hypothetical protein
LPKQLKVGVIAPMSGIGQFIGEIVERSLGAAKQHLRQEGTFKGVDIAWS